MCLRTLTLTYTHHKHVAASLTNDMVQHVHTSEAFVFLLPFLICVTEMVAVPITRGKKKVKLFLCYIHRK